MVNLGCMAMEKLNRIPKM